MVETLLYLIHHSFSLKPCTIYNCYHTFYLFTIFYYSTQTTNFSNFDLNFFNFEIVHSTYIIMYDISGQNQEF